MMYVQRHGDANGRTSSRCSLEYAACGDASGFRFSRARATREQQSGGRIGHNDRLAAYGKRVAKPCGSAVKVTALLCKTILLCAARDGSEQHSGSGQLPECHSISLVQHCVDELFEA